MCDLCVTRMYLRAVDLSAYNETESKYITPSSPHAFCISFSRMRPVGIITFVSLSSCRAPECGNDRAGAGRWGGFLLRRSGPVGYPLTHRLEWSRAGQTRPNCAIMPDSMKTDVSTSGCPDEIKLKICLILNNLNFGCRMKIIVIKKYKPPPGELINIVPTSVCRRAHRMVGNWMSLLGSVLVIHHMWLES